MSDPQSPGGGSTPPLSPGVAHAPLVSVDVVVRTTPNVDGNGDQNAGCAPSIPVEIT